MTTISRRGFLGAAASAPLAFAQPPKAEASVGLPAKAVTGGDQHSWFGYYDKCPWDASGRYLLCHKNSFCDRQPKAAETIAVGYVDLQNNNEFIKLGDTAAWSWQQGTMLQWAGGHKEHVAVWNGIQNGKYVGMMKSPRGKFAVVFPRPIYALSNDGAQAVSLDFSRLHRLRPGYGYASLPEKYADQPAPEELGIWHMKIPIGGDKLIISIAQLAKHEPLESFQGAEHWVNHLQFNPSGTRFCFLHRWRRPSDRVWTTRLYTAKPDGKDLKILHDSGMVSHFDWRDDNTMLAWVKVKKGEARNAFCLLDVNGKPPEIVFESETQDGHCSYSPDRKWVLNDTYPDKERMQHLMLLNVKTGRRHSLNKFLSPKQFTGPVRCDLHPRWNRDGTQICFDGCHNEKRQVYVVDVKDIVNG